MKIILYGVTVVAIVLMSEHGCFTTAKKRARGVEVLR